jgi:hypothetical protein
VDFLISDTRARRMSFSQAIRITTPLTPSPEDSCGDEDRSHQNIPHIDEDLERFPRHLATITRNESVPQTVS